MSSKKTSAPATSSNTAVLSDDAPPRTSSSDIDNILAEMASLAEMATGDESSLYDAALPTASGEAVSLDDDPPDRAASQVRSPQSSPVSTAAVPVEPAAAADDLSDIEAALQEATSMLDAADANPSTPVDSTHDGQTGTCGVATETSEDDELAELLADAEAERLLSQYEAGPAQDPASIPADADTDVDLADALSALDGTPGESNTVATGEPASDELQVARADRPDDATPSSEQLTTEDGNPWVEEVQAMEQAWAQGEEAPLDSDAGQTAHTGKAPFLPDAASAATGRPALARGRVRLLAGRTCDIAFGGLAWGLVKLDRPFAGVPLRLKRLVGAAAWASLLLAVMLWLATPWIKPLMH